MPDGPRAETPPSAVPAFVRNRKEYLMLKTDHAGYERKKLGGEGEGTAILIDWVDRDKLPPNLNMISTVTLPPGASVSDHMHEGDAEIYRIVNGHGMYNDNGVEVEVKPGDVTMCLSGERHGLKNTGDDVLVFDAIIIGG